MEKFHLSYVDSNRESKYKHNNYVLVKYSEPEVWEWNLVLKEDLIPITEKRIKYIMVNRIERIGKWITVFLWDSMLCHL